MLVSQNSDWTYAQKFGSPAAERRLVEHGFLFQERQKIYSLPFSNENVHMMKKKRQPDCPYCHDIGQTPLHLFVECSIAQSFWNKFTKWYHATCGGIIVLEQNEITYGVLRYTSSRLTLNHLVIVGKYFLLHI